MKWVIIVEFPQDVDNNVSFLCSIEPEVKIAEFYFMETHLYATES